MAIEKTIEIKANTTQATKGINDVVNSIDNLSDVTKKANDDTVKGFEKTEKQIGAVGNSVSSLSNGFKSVGLAIKGLGIGLLLSAFETLKNLFQQNQKIADFFGTTMKSLEIVFNDLFNLILGDGSGVSKFFNTLFTQPLEAVKQLGNAIKDNLIERFMSFNEVIGYTGKALISFFKGNFKEALANIKEAGVELVDVATGVDNSAEKIANYGSEVIKTASSIQKLENQSKIAEARQRQLVLQFSKQAELLRQIRDDDSKSIPERIEANNKLGKVLQQQGDAMKGLASIQIQSAKNQYALNQSIENRVALIDAETNAIDVQEQVTGFLSEQLTNRNSLLREEQDLLKSKGQTEAEIAINQKLFEAERLKDEEMKLEAQKEALEFQKNLELERLQFNISLYKEGTQARIDAENEFALKKQEIDNNILAKEDEIKKYRFEKQLEDKQKEIDDDQLLFEDRLALLQERENIIRSNSELNYQQEQMLLKENTAKKNAILEEQAQTEENREKALSEFKQNLANDTLSLLGGLAKQGSKLGKAVAIAQATISTFQGVNKALAETTDFTPTQSLRFLNASLVGATGLANIQKIVSTPDISTGGTSSGGGIATPQAPSFNLVQGTGTNQIAESLATQKQPLKAYVVASEVSTQQSLERNIQSNASI